MNKRLKETLPGEEFPVERTACAMTMRCDDVRHVEKQPEGQCGLSEVRGGSERRGQPVNGAEFKAETFFVVL